VVEGKLQLAIKPFCSLPLQGVMDGVCRKHLEMQQGLREEVTRLLRTRKLRYGSDCLVLVNDEIKKAGIPATNASGQARAKAGEGQGRAYQRPQGGVKDPGRKGGKFYRTASGKIRYGTKPVEGAEEAKPEEVAAHLVHFRPIPFLANTKEHRELLGAILALKTGGFNEQDKELLDWWSKAEKTFKKVYKLSDDDLQGQLGESSYQEQVHEFFMAQDWGDTSKEEVTEALEGCFERYKKALSDPSVQKYAEATALDAEKRIYGWFHKAEAQSEHYDKLTSLVLNNQPEQAAPHLITALGSLQLIFKPDASQRAGEYKGVLAPNNGWLSEDKDEEGYLLTLGKDHLDRLTIPQLMSVISGSLLNAAWQPETMTYDVFTDGLAASGLQPKLVSAATAELAKKLKQDVNSALFHQAMGHIIRATRNVAEMLSRSNTGSDTSQVARKLLDIPAEKMGDDDIVQKIVEDAQKFEQLKVDALTAQEDDSWVVPKTMKDGAIGGSKINPVTGQPFDLFKHQKQAVNWALTVKRGILADDAGMGKTGEVIAIAETLKEQKKIKRAILFLPPSLLAQWQKEITSFAPAMGEAGRILNLSGLSMEARKTALTSDMAKNAEYILMSTGSLSYGRGKGEDDEGMDDALVDTLSKLDGMVMIDEAHQGGFKTGPTRVNGEEVPGTVRHEIAKRIIGDRDYSFLGTATPVPKEPVDLFNLINLVNPGSVGDRAEWEGKLHGVYYNEDLQQWKVDKPENIVEINKRVKPFVLHRLITDPKIEADMKNALPKLQYKKKNEATGEIETHEGTQAVDLQPSNEKCKVTGFSQLDYLRPGGICSVFAQKKLDEVKQKWKEQGKTMAENAEFLVLASIERNLHRLASISPELIDPRYTGPAPKIEWIANNVIDHFSGGSGQDGRPIVCFSSLPGKAFPVLQRALAKAGIDPSGIGQITGANSSEERAFQQDMLNGYERKHPETGEKEFVPGKLKVLLVGTEAGGAGLNLQKAANRAIFLDNPPTPGRKRQALGRVWRTGQKLPVQVDNLGMLGTLDTSIEQRMGQRQMMATALLGEPNEHAFSQAADAAIKALSGRGLAADASGGLSSEQMTALLKNAGDLDLGSLFQDEEDFDEADLDDEPKVAAKVKTLKLERPQVNVEARDRLKSKAPKLTEEVNTEEESQKWQHEMLRQTAKSRYDVFMTQSQVSTQKGDHDAAARSVKAAEKIKLLFPDAFEKTTKTAAEKAGKKQDSAWDKRLRDEDKQIKDEAAKLNAGDKAAKGKDPLAKITSHKAAQHIVDNHRHFDPDTVKQAKELLGGIGKHEKEVGRLHDEEAWLTREGHHKEASEKARERDKYINENLPKDYAEATGRHGERVLAGKGAVPRKPEGFVPPKKPEPVKAAPAKAKEPQVKLHPKNPFHKKDDNVAHAAYEHLKEAAPKTDKELDAALLEYVKDRYSGKPAAMLQTAKELKRYLQDEKAVQLA
jgi:hypothetical protein